MLALWIALTAWLLGAALLTAFVGGGVTASGQRVSLPRYAVRSLAWPWAVAQWAWGRMQ